MDETTNPNGGNDNGAPSTEENTPETETEQAM